MAEVVYRSIIAKMLPSRQMMEVKLRFSQKVNTRAAILRPHLMLAAAAYLLLTQSISGDYFNRMGTDSYSVSFINDHSIKGHMEGCFVYRKLTGSWQASENHVRIKWSLDPELNLPERFTKVKWGAVNLLIADEDLLIFCENVRGGWRGRAPGFPMFRDDVSPLKEQKGDVFQGVPEVPAELEPYLTKPFTAVLSYNSDGSAWVDKGTREGLLPGTFLNYEEADLAVLVTKVEAHQAVVKVISGRDNRASRVLSPTGWRFSMPWLPYKDVVYNDK